MTTHGWCNFRIEGKDERVLDIPIFIYNRVSRLAFESRDEAFVRLYMDACGGIRPLAVGFDHQVNPTKYVVRIASSTDEQGIQAFVDTVTASLTN